MQLALFSEQKLLDPSMEAELKSGICDVIYIQRNGLDHGVHDFFVLYPFLQKTEVPFHILSVLPLEYQPTFVTDTKSPPPIATSPKHLQH